VSATPGVLISTGTLRVLARLISLGMVMGGSLLVLYGWPWAVFSVAIAAHTLGVLSGMAWFLDPWMAAMQRRMER
jgi:hypothetical protein